MKEKEKTIAILEIASDSVGGMLIRQNKIGKPEIVFLTRIPVNFLFDVNFDAFWRCTLVALKRVIKVLLGNCPLRRPDICLCVFLSPWFLSQNKIVDIRREKEFKITPALLENLVKIEEKSFKNQEIRQPRGELEFVEHEIIKTELNGYYTKLPVGKIAKTIRLHIYMSLGAKNVKKKIGEEVLENFGDIPVFFRTFPLVAFQILNSSTENQEGLILVNIGGEITDISLIRKNCLEETVSFPRGRNFLLRKISSEFRTFPEEANSLLQTYLRGHSLVSGSEKISKIIEDVKKDWGNFFEMAIKNIFENPPAGGPLPQNLFLVGDEIVSGQFIKCAEEEKFSQYTFLGKPFNVKKILDKETDTFLMMGALFANKFL